MKKTLLMMFVFVFVSGISFADSAPVQGSSKKHMKPLFYFGVVDSVDTKGVNITNVHGEKISIHNNETVEVYGFHGEKILLGDLKKDDRLKICYNFESGATVAIYKVHAVTKAEKEAYYQAHKISSK